MIRIYTKELFAVLFLLALCCWSNQTVYAQCLVGEEEFEITVANFGFPGEVGWALYDDQDVEIASQGCGTITSFADQVTNVCLIPGDTYTFEAYDSFGDGWNGGDLTIENLDDVCVIQDATDITTTLSAPVPAYSNVCTAGFNPQMEFQYEFTPDAIEGCTDPAATNYIPCAIIDDGSCVYPPPNDECAGAIPIPVQVGTCAPDITATNVAATSSTGSPLPTCGFFQGGDIWYTVTVPASGDVIISGLSNGFPLPTDMSMQTYTGTDCGSLALLECDDFDGPGAMPLISLSGQTPGETIYVRLWEDFNDTEGDFLIGAFEPATGSSCENSISIGTSGADLPFEVFGASTECTGNNYPAIGDGNTLCGHFTFADNDIIYSFTPTDDINIDIEVTNASDGVDIFVFDECPDVDVNACVDQGLFAAFGFQAGPFTLPSVELTGGTTYYIVVQSDGFPDVLDSFDLLIEENIPLSCDDPLIGIAVDIALANFPGEVGWEILGTGLGADCGSAATGVFEECLDPNLGDYTFLAYDSFGDGWNGGTYQVEIVTGPDAGCILGFGSPGTLNADVPESVNCGGFNPETEDTFTFNLLDVQCITGFDCSTATVVDVNDLPYIEEPGGGLGSTCGFGDDYNTGEAPCGSQFAQEEDKIYSITPTEDMVVNINLNLVNTFNDPGMFVYDDCPDVATANCVDFVQGFNQSEMDIFELVLMAGTTYYIQLDHVNSFFNCYNYTLTIEQIPCGSEAGTPIAPNQQVCMVADPNSEAAIPDPTVPFVDADAVVVSPPDDSFLIGADSLAYNYIVTDLSASSSFVGISDDGSFQLPNIIGTNYCFTGIIYDPISVQTILCDPDNAAFWATKGIGCGASLNDFITAVNPTAGTSPYNVPTINDALNNLCNLLPGECELCYETAAPENVYCVGVFNCEDINCGTVNPNYSLGGAEPICEDDDLDLDANYVLVDKEVEGVNFILTWFENGEQIAQTGTGEDGVYGTGDEVLVEQYTHAADYAVDACTSTISSNEYEVQLSCIGKAFDNSTYANIITGYYAPPTDGIEFVFNFTNVPLQAIAQNLEITIGGQAINFAEAADVRVDILAPDGSDADNAPDFVTTLSGVGGTAAAWEINEVLTTELENIEVVAGIWTIVVYDGDFVENGGFPVPEGIVTSIDLSLNWMTNEPPVVATDLLTGDTVVDIYDSAQDGIDFQLPEGCAGEITQLCPNVLIEYSLDGGQTWSTTAPEDLNIGEADQEVAYQVSVDGVPTACANEGVYIQTCPCEADACHIITEDYIITSCIEDPVILDIYSGNFEEVDDFGGDFLATGLNHTRCGGSTSTFANYPYEAFEFQVSETGEYTITVSWENVNGFVNLYEGEFTPTTGTTSCINRIAFDDDFPGFDQTGSQIENVTLETGVNYILVYTIDNGFQTAASGVYDATFDGPGDILSVNPDCADPTIYGLEYLITDINTDVIAGLGTDFTDYPEGIYTVCGFSFINGVTDPTSLIGTSYTALVQDAADKTICADVETGPTCITVAVTPECDGGDCPNFIAALAAEEQLCQGEPGLFEILLTNDERWTVTSINDTEWEFGNEGAGTNFIGSLENNAVYFAAENGTADEASLISPVFDLTDLTDVTVSFDVNFQQSDFFGVDEELDILFFNSATGLWDSQETLTGDTPGGCFGNPAICSQNVSVDVPDEYLNDEFQVQFTFTDNAAFSIGVGLDNFAVINNAPATPEEGQIFFDDFELGNVNYQVVWTDPEGNTYGGAEVEIPLTLDANLGTTCLSEPKEVNYAVICLDTGETIEDGIVLVEVFPTLEEGVHFDLPEQQGCELEIVTNCGAQGNILVSYSRTGAEGTYEPSPPPNPNPGEAQTIFYQVNTIGAPEKCAATGVYTASCPFDCPSVTSTNISLEACGNTLTLFEVDVDIPFAESAINDYEGTIVGRPLWDRPVGATENLAGEDVRFDIFSFKVPVADNYSFDANFNGFNGYLHLYAGSFDPTAPFSDLVDGDDGVGTSASIDASLEEDETYYLVISGNEPTDEGTFTLDISGGIDAVIHRVPTTEVIWSYNAEQYASGFPAPLRLQVIDAACGKELQPIYYSVQCTSLGAGIYWDIAKVDVFTKLEVNVDFAIPDLYQNSNDACSSALINTQCPAELVDFQYSTNPNGPFSPAPPALAPGTGIVVYYTASLVDGPAGCGISGDSYIVSCPNCPTFNDLTAGAVTVCTNTDVSFDADIDDGLLQVQGTINTLNGTNVGGPLINNGFQFGDSPYDVFIFTVPVSGTYLINQTQDYDGLLALYENNFDASAPTVNQIEFNDNGAGGIGTSSMAVGLSAGTIYYLVTSGHADPFGFFSDGSGFEGTFTTEFLPGVSPFLQVYDLAWTYGFQGSNSESTAFTIINDQSCGVDKQDINLEVTCRGTGDILADTTLQLSVYPILSPIVNFFVPGPIAPGIPNTDSCTLNIIFDLCVDTDTELDIAYSLDGINFVEFSEDDPASETVDETYTIDSLFNDQTPVDNVGVDFDLGPKESALLTIGEAALIFFEIDRPGSPGACKTASGTFTEACIDASESFCPSFNFTATNGVVNDEAAGEYGDACANTLVTFAIDIDFNDIPALGAPNYTTQWFGPNGEQPNPLERTLLQKQFPVRSNAACEIVQDSAVVILDCVSSFPSDAALLFPKTIPVKVDIYPAPPPNPAEYFSFTTDGCKGIVIENLGCAPVDYLVLDEPTFPLEVNDVGTAIYELTWDGGPCCAPGVEINRVTDGSFELTPPGIPLPNWNTQYFSSDAPTLASSFHTFLPHCDNLTCNSGGSPLAPAPNMTASSPGLDVNKAFNLWGFLWFGGISGVDFDERASQGLRVAVNADFVEFRFQNNSCAGGGENFDFIELTIDGEQAWLQTTDPGADAEDQAPCGGGYSTISVDVTPWADGLQHVFSFHGHFYGNGGFTNFAIDDVEIMTDCDYSNPEALVEVPYSCLCGEPLEPAYGQNAVGCGSVTYMLPTSIPVDNDELAVFTWTDFTTGEVVPAGVEFTLDHPGGCAGVQSRTFVVEVTCSEDPDFSAFGGSYVVTAYPPLEDGDFELPAPNSCSPEITITDGCDETPFEVFYSTDNATFSTTVPDDLVQGTSVQFWYKVSARGDGGQAPSDTDCVAEGTYTLTCTQCAFPTLVSGIEGDRCGNELEVDAEISIEGTFIAPTSVEWFLNGQSTGETGTSYSGELPEVEGCAVSTYELTASVVCSLDDAPITISAGSVNVYGLPTLDEDFSQPAFCSAGLENVCEGVNVAYSVNGLPVDGEPTDVANGAIVAYTVSVEGAPEGCASTGFYFYNCPECAESELAAGIEGEFCASDVDVLAAISASGGVNSTTSCEWFINGEPTGFIGFVYQSTLASSGVVEPTSYNLTAVCSCTVQDGNEIIPFADAVTVDAGTVVVFPAPQLSAVSSETQSICSGESTELSVSVVNADPSDIVWTNTSGEVVATGTSFNTGEIENAVNCNGQLETYTASVAGGTVPSCDDAVSAVFEVNVLPDAGTNVAVIQDGCTISVLGICEGFTVVHRSDGGPLQVGNTFTASAPAPGEISQVDVEFIVTSTNGCGNLSIPAAFECFGQELSTISGIAFRDLNQDGIWQSTEEGPGLAAEVEPGMPNILVKLYKVAESGEEINVNSKFTDAQGIYTFDELDEGVYYLVFAIPQGFVAALPDQFADENFDSDIDANGRTDNFVITEGNELLGVNAGFTFEGCAGNAGVMATGSIAICGADQVAGASASGAVVPDGYAQVYVLHDGSGASLGNVIAVNETVGSFTVEQIGGLGTYYISSVVGPDADADGFPDLEDPCTQIATGTMVTVLDGLILGDAVQNPTTDNYDLAINANGGTVGTYTFTVVVETLEDGTIVFEDTFTYNEGDDPIVITGLPMNTLYTITATDGSGCDAVASQVVEDTVPVELLDFSGEVQEIGNMLNWITATEINNDFFTLYHSTDEVNFEAISVVDAAGNSSNANTYNFLHRDAPNGVSYYRLDQTDFDGRTSSSNVISLVRGEGGFGIVEVLPVPARDFVNLTFTSTDNTEITGRLHDVSGKVLANFKVDAKGGLNTIKVDVSSYPIGVYLLTINNGSELLSTKVIKE